MSPKQREAYSQQEAQERERKALAAALSMGPIHHRESSPRKKKKPNKIGKKK